MKILSKEEIFQKAKSINDEKEINRRHKKECLKANICPECGEVLKKYKDEDYSNVTECSFNLNHYRSILYHHYDNE